jgi:hypothetical protein
MAYLNPQEARMLEQILSMGYVLFQMTSGGWLFQMTGEYESNYASWQFDA